MARNGHMLLTLKTNNWLENLHVEEPRAGEVLEGAETCGLKHEQLLFPRARTQGGRCKSQSWATSSGQHVRVELAFELYFLLADIRSDCAAHSPDGEERRSFSSRRTCSVPFAANFPRTYDRPGDENMPRYFFFLPAKVNALHVCPGTRSV